MKRFFETKDIFLVGGPGGVGKTTVAAALGIELARAGYRTIVLTVDPARRLAQALGFKGFSSDIQRVELPDKSDAVLFATMLDTQRYFDKVMERFALSPEQKERILNNSLYRVTIDNLGGTHEYAAMERLLEFASDKQYEKVVVDTPPTQNAVDLLSAPQRFADFMDNSVLQWFQKSDKKYLQFFRRGTVIAMKVLQRILGGEFFDQLGGFLSELGGMQAGFHQRNLDVINLLRSARTAFLLVSYPSEVRYLESVAFGRTLAENRIPLAALILNRLEPKAASADAAPEDVREIARYFEGLFLQERHWAERFATSFPELPAILIEKRDKALHDLRSLSQLGEQLIQ